MVLIKMHDLFYSGGWGVEEFCVTRKTAPFVA